MTHTSNPLADALSRRHPPLDASLEHLTDSELADIELELAYCGTCSGQGCAHCRGLGEVWVFAKEGR